MLLLWIKCNAALRCSLQAPSVLPSFCFLALLGMLGHHSPKAKHVAGEVCCYSTGDLQTVSVQQLVTKLPLLYNYKVFVCNIF